MERYKLHQIRQDDQNTENFKTEKNENLETSTPNIKEAEAKEQGDANKNHLDFSD